MTKIEFIFITLRTVEKCQVRDGGCIDGFTVGIQNQHFSKAVKTYVQSRS